MEIISLCYVAFWCTLQVCNDRSMHDKSKTICLFREGLVALTLVNDVTVITQTLFY